MYSDDWPAPAQLTPTEAADVAEITQRIYYYGWCIDHRRFDLLDALFLPETRIHYDVGGGTAASWSEMKGWLAQALQIFRCTQHNMSNPMVALDGSTARSATYGHLIHFQELLDGSISIMRHHAVYTDRWERRDDGWRILDRTLSNLHADGPVHQADAVRTFADPVPIE